MKQFDKLWISGARPRTLPAAIAPVMVGAACAGSLDSPEWINGLLALVVSLALQVAVNYSNDYSDGIRGTDLLRVGPLRLVGSGAKSPAAVKRAALVSFLVAAIGGLILAATTSWYLLIVGVACFAAGWFYTGGSKPYGYYGFGELFVFVFFGVVATTGTTFVIVEELPSVSIVASIVVGCLACALLVTNNLRDIPNDTISGKKTLAVRIGDKRTRQLYFVLIAMAAIGIGGITTSNQLAVFGLVGLITILPALRKIANGAKGENLIAVLAITGRAQLLTAICLSLGIYFS